MRALIRKAFLEAGILAAIPFLALCAVWFVAAKFEDVLLAPQGEPILGVVLTALFAGVLIALWQFEGERRRGTETYLLHRGTGARGLFRAKAVAGIAVTFALAIGPVIAFALAHALFTTNRPIVQWSRVLELAAFATLGATVWSIAAAAAQLRRALAVDIVVALFGAGGILLVVFLASITLSFVETGGMACFVALQVLASWLLLRLGEAMHARPADRDLALAPRHHAAWLAVALLALLPFASLLLSAAQSWLLQGIERNAPSIVRDRASGEVRVEDRRDVWSRLSGRVAYLGGSQGAVAVVPPTARPEPELDELFHPLYAPLTRLPDSAAVPVVPRRRPGFPPHWERLWFGSGQGYDSSSGRFCIHAFLDQGAGLVRMFALLDERIDARGLRLDPGSMPPSVPFAASYGKPGGSGRFSPATMAVQNYLDPRQFLADPEDGTLWLLELPGFSQPLSALALPGSDRFVALERRLDRGQARLGRSVPQAHFQVRGERGLYDLKGKQFETYDPAQDEGGVAPEEARGLAQVKVAVVDPDPLTAVVEVRDAKDGSILLTHSYALNTTVQQADALLLQGVALLESPLGNACSFFAAGESTWLQLRAIDPVHQPLLASRSRPVLLLACLALAALCLLDLARRQRRRGAAVGLVAGSAVLVALFGVPAWLLLRCLEPRTVPRAEPEARRVEEPVLLIQSA